MQLYVYDLSGGLARSLSVPLLGQQIDGVWHTSVVVSGLEHYFGGGINVAPAGTTPFGQPVQVVDLGRTLLPQDVREALLVDLSERYTPESYSLFDFNCNNFSDELAQLLTGNGIPGHITGLPATVLASPFGQMLRPMLSGLEAQMRAMRQQAYSPHTFDGEASTSQEASVDGPSPAAAPAEEPLSAVPSSPPQTQPQLSAGRASAAGAAGELGSNGVHEGPAIVAAERELEAAVAEAAAAELDLTLTELDLKEGRRTPREQLSKATADRMALEVAVKKEYERLMASDGGVDPKEAEALAVEHVAAIAAKKPQP